MGGHCVLYTVKQSFKKEKPGDDLAASLKKGDHGRFLEKTWPTVENKNEGYFNLENRRGYLGLGRHRKLYPKEITGGKL